MEKINYQATTFFKSCAKITDCPPDVGCEVAFAGRSNVGKSSVLNTLVNKTSLARTSKTPGRTQLLNYFQLADNQFLVDLPGYGYAKVPDKIKKQWQYALEDYFQTRQSLVGIVLIMDIRHPLKPLDEFMINMAQDHNLPLHIVLNKADKIKRGPANNTRQQIQSQFNPDLVSVQLFSSLKKQGVEDLKQKLDVWLLATD